METFVNDHFKNIAHLDDHEEETIKVLGSYIEFKKRINRLFRDID